ncbi:hypothetical protein Nepgr_025406 [Nepenthes gracilis]|uniref:SWI/SNF complex subunit SWI3D n=1 Tax=Nepenthes gracilis TaxID=150966 RepID=A0AAD3XZM7_NEPGR|nr:hypothetical protein Nepgr_025406 [Nepenthes gracilis]
MEEKRREAPGSLAPAATSEKSGENLSSEPNVSRRRGVKRKANNSNISTASSTPSKRYSREKPNAPLPPMHNGPLTRARQLSDSVVTSSAISSGKNELSPASEEASLGKEIFDASEAAIEAEFEVIRSRDVNTHVVPFHAGWFSWTKVHPIEELALPSFFNGRSECRTPEIYMEIRNWIMKKFHANPNVQIEFKDLSDFEVGELDARQEVLEFLNHWGLINYHPFPPKDTDTTNANVNADADKPDTADSLIEKLYRFETEQSYSQLFPGSNVPTPSMPPGLFPDSAIAEELAKQEGPTVELEYHCNSCSADCSRKRYHCQKQADFDLCPECYNNEKLGSGMNLSDFIIMEPAEASGASGGKWTDQETLLLLEALELYKENWNEIAEHVATKTKAQCILHFLQMPIEDSFLESDNEIKYDLQENADPTNDASVPKDASEAFEGKTGASEVQPRSSLMEPSNREGVQDARLGQDTVDNIALKALKEAFETVGFPLTPEDKLSFAQAGNPVMALAAFIVRLVEPGAATASAHSSLKLLSGNSPSMQLAARHCFLLEDPADDKKERTGSDSAAAEKVDQGVQERKHKDENHKDMIHDEKNSIRQNEEKSMHVLGGTGLKNNQKDNKMKDLAPEENTTVSSQLQDECADKSEAAYKPDETSSHKQDGQNIVKDLDESTNPDLQKDEPSSELKDLDDSGSRVELPPGFVKKQVDRPSVVKPSECAKAQKSVDMESGSTLADKEELKEPLAADSVVGDEANTGEDKTKDTKTGDQKPAETKDDHTADKLKRAAITTIAAAAVKAKLLAKQEEDEIRQLAALLIDKQLRKLEVKMTFFAEMGNSIMKVREHLERSRQKLYHERAQIIAARLGLPASSSRAMPPMISANRTPVGFATSMPRPPLSITAQRPPFSRPFMTSAPPLSNPYAPSVAAGATSMQPSRQ